MTRKSNPARPALFTASRLTLPGHDPGYEERMRAKLASSFMPANALEDIWVDDIAHCMASIEHDRALISAFKRVCVERNYTSIMQPDFRLFDEETLDAQGHRIERDRALLDLTARRDFVPEEGESFLGDTAFARILGVLSMQDQRALGALQADLREQMRERDRIVRQIDRRRRNAMSAAMEQVAQATLEDPAEKEDPEVDEGAVAPAMELDAAEDRDVELDQ